MTEPSRRGRRRKRRRSRSRWLSPVRLRLVAAAVVIGVLATLATSWYLRRRSSGGVTSRAYNVARLALGAGDLETAVREARTAVEEAPASREARLLLALALHRRGESDEASTLLAEDVRRDPDYDDGRLVLAAFAMRDEDYATALTLLREAVARDPTPAGAWRLLGDVRGLTGNADGAENAYRRAVETDPGDVRAWLSLGDVRLARALETSSVVAREQAGHAYEQAESLARMELAGGSTTAGRLALAKALAGRVRAIRDASLAEAEAEIRTLVEESGDDVEPTLALAAFLRGVGRDSDARVVLEAAERRWRSAAPRRALSRVLESLGEDSEAVAAMRRAVAADPRDEVSRAELVALLVRLDRLDEASDELASAPEDVADAGRLHETAGDLARARALRAEAAGDPEAGAEHRAAARSAYTRALARRPRSMPLQKKRFGELLEAAAERPGALSAEERAAAERYALDVLELNPFDADALAWRARQLLVEDDAEAAVTLLGPSAASEAPPVDLLRLYGAACERTGRSERAAEAYDRVLARLSRRDDPARDDRAAPPAVWRDAVRGWIRAGRHELAGVVATHAVEAWPGSLELQVLRADALLLSGRADDALNALTVAADAFPDSVDVAVRTARLHERAGRSTEAEAVLRAAGDGPDVRFALAGVLGRAGRRDEMSAELAAAAAATTDAAGAAVRTADVLLSLQPPEVESARAALESAAETVPDARAVLVRLAELALLDAAADEARIPAARDAVHRAVPPGAAGWVRPYLDGKLALLDGDARTAVRRLERAVEKGARSAAVLYYLARAHRAAGASREAREPLTQAFEIDPVDRRIEDELVALRLHLASEALVEGRSAETLLLLEDVPDDAARTWLLALARTARSEWDAAELQARRFLAERPDDAVAEHVLAAVLVRRGGEPRLSEAAALYAGLVEDDPDDVHALVGRAAALHALGDLEGASTAWSQAAASRPTDVRILRGRVTCLVAAGRAADALAHVETAIEQGAATGETAALRADLLLHLGRPDAAAAAYSMSAEADRSDVRPLLGAAAALAAAGREDEARRMLETRVPRCDDPRPGWLALGDLRARSGDLEGAREALERARGGGLPSSYEVLLSGGVDEAEGHVERAQRTYALLVVEDDLRAVTLSRLGALLAAAGETRRALDAYDALLRLRPDDAAAINNRALLLAQDDGGLEDALAEVRRARELAPASPHVADTLGWLLVRDGRPADARMLLEEAAAALSGEPRVRFHLGMCLARLGEVDPARTELARALELDPLFPGADAALAQLERLR
jgi:tetratricopeptide (TPR) repeat protein